MNTSGNNNYNYSGRGRRSERGSFRGGNRGGYNNPNPRFRRRKYPIALDEPIGRNLPLKRKMLNM